MSDLIVETPLSIEKITENSKDIDVLSGLQETLEDIKAWKCGEEVPGMVIHEQTLPDVDTQ